MNLEEWCWLLSSLIILFSVYLEYCMKVEYTSNVIHQICVIEGATFQMAPSPRCIRCCVLMGSPSDLPVNRFNPSLWVYTCVSWGTECGRRMTFHLNINAVLHWFTKGSVGVCSCTPRGSEVRTWRIYSWNCTYIRPTSLNVWTDVHRWLQQRD